MAKPEIVEMLDELGFSRGCIVETIVATRNPDGLPGAAPMGVTRSGPDILEIKPFKSSDTYRNLLKGRDACVNVAGDPELFLTTAFKHETLEGFKTPHINENLSLRTEDASIHVEILRGYDISENRGCFVCKVNSVDVHRPLPRVFSRGRAEAIEAVVHATRIEEYIHLGLLGDAEKLNKKFNECKEVVEKVSTLDSAELRVVLALENLIKGWREEKSR